MINNNSCNNDKNVTSSLNHFTSANDSPLSLLSQLQTATTTDDDIFSHDEINQAFNEVLSTFVDPSVNLNSIFYQCGLGENNSSSGNNNNNWNSDRNISEVINLDFNLDRDDRNTISPLNINNSNTNSNNLISDSVDPYLNFLNEDLPSSLNLFPDIIPLTTNHHMEIETHKNVNLSNSTSVQLETNFNNLPCIVQNLNHVHKKHFQVLKRHASSTTDDNIPKKMSGFQHQKQHSGINFCNSLQQQQQFPNEKQLTAQLAQLQQQHQQPLLLQQKLLQLHQQQQHQLQQRPQHYLQPQQLTQHQKLQQQQPYQQSQQLLQHQQHIYGQQHNPQHLNLQNALKATDLHVSPQQYQFNLQHPIQQHSQHQQHLQQIPQLPQQQQQLTQHQQLSPQRHQQRHLFKFQCENQPLLFSQQNLETEQESKSIEDEFLSTFFDSTINKVVENNEMPNLNFINANILDTTQEDVFNLTFTDAPLVVNNQFNLKQNVANLHQHPQQQDLTTAQLHTASLQTTSTGDKNSLENMHTVSPLQKGQQQQQNQQQQQQQNQQLQQIRHLQQQQQLLQQQHQQHQLVKQPTSQQQRDIQEQKISDYAFNCLTEFDFCVLDHFQGSQKSLNLLDEVQKIINNQRFEDGRLMAANQDSLSVRGDKIFWMGDLNMTPCIMQLIQKMDRIIFKFNEKLSNIYIRSHSKPMLACYPGSGAGYMRHVDNSNQDGRLITCLYYLNKNWNAKNDGGILRLHPSIKHEKVDVEPLLDRLLLFWSDCRNPHEVLPSFKNRYAITVWYFDTVEREQAKLKLQDSQKDSSKYVLPSQAAYP